MTATRTLRIESECHDRDQDGLFVVMTDDDKVNEYNVVAAFGEAGAVVTWCHDEDCHRSYSVFVNPQGIAFRCTCPDYQYRVAAKKKPSCKHQDATMSLVGRGKIRYGVVCRKPEPQGV